MTDRVLLLDYPVQLGISVAEHVEDWVREFKLMSLGRQGGTASTDVPERLMQMVQALTSRYATELSEQDRQRAEAAARGEATVDLSYPVRPETRPTVLAWCEMLDAVDAYCRSEDLLPLQRTPAQVELMDWITDQFLRQLAGGEPTPWAGAVEPVSP